MLQAEPSRIMAEKVLSYLYKIIFFEKQMLQAANTDFFNPLVPRVPKIEIRQLALTDNYWLNL